MSRFARLQGGAVRTWAPEASPLRIEYSPALLMEIRHSSGKANTSGMLYGVRQGENIRIVATHSRSGLDPVGTFASRIRGKVFLTEQDLEQFDRAEASIALVIAGDKAGFFVRDSSGAIETVRSYEEFIIPGTVVAPQKRRMHWAACLALLPLLYFVPRHKQPPLALNLREEAGQMKISWNIPIETNLTILDGNERTSVPIARQYSTITYARRSGDVTVGMGAVKARFVGPAIPPSEIEQARADVASLESQAASLTAAQEIARLKIAELQRRLQ